MKFEVLIYTLLFELLINPLVFSQNTEKNIQNIPILSSAPVCFRINENDGSLHGYYKKGYHLIIYGDTSSIGYRADCDEDEDWSGAKVEGTTQASNSFETTYKCEFNPNILFGTVLPGNKTGQNHWDNLKKVGVHVGDLTITYKLAINNHPIDSVYGVVFDRGPQSQPGESSVAVCNRFKSALDNNQFIYIVFPNTAKYLEKVIGMKNDNKSLTRTPTNMDFEKAFQLMTKEKSYYGRKKTQIELLNLLTTKSIVSNFDNANEKEKVDGKQKPKNNDRNINE